MRMVAGATGLIGKRLVLHWLSQQQKIMVVGRSEKHIRDVFNNRVQAITWDHLTTELLQSAEVIVNLAGASIAGKRWTPAYKEELLNSRIQTTLKLAQLLAPLGKSSPPLFNASAIGIYGLQVQQKLNLPEHFDETATFSGAAPDFLANIGRQWEAAAQPAIDAGVRVVFLRFGVVLAKEGGALPQIARPFYFFLGGKVGTGHQPFCWIAIDDVIRIIDFLIEKPDSRGPYNLSAPECVRQEYLAQTIARVLKRPAFMNVPAFVLKMMLGEEMANVLLLQGQNVYPKRLVELGYQFQYPNIQSALQHVLKNI